MAIEALSQLAALDERLARVVECRFFGGLTEEETPGQGPPPNPVSVDSGQTAEDST
jgi:hypothetical protein